MPKKISLSEPVKLATDTEIRNIYEYRSNLSGKKVIFLAPQSLDPKKVNLCLHTIYQREFGEDESKLAPKGRGEKPKDPQEIFQDQNWLSEKTIIEIAAVEESSDEVIGDCIDEAQLTATLGRIEELLEQSRPSYIPLEIEELLQKDPNREVTKETKDRVNQEKLAKKEEAFKLYDDLLKKTIKIKKLTPEKEASYNAKYIAIGEKINAVKVKDALANLILLRSDIEAHCDADDFEKAGDLIKEFKKSLEKLELSEAEGVYFTSELTKLIREVEVKLSKQINDAIQGADYQLAMKYVQRLKTYLKKIGCPENEIEQKIKAFEKNISTSRFDQKAFREELKRDLLQFFQSNIEITHKGKSPSETGKSGRNSGNPQTRRDLEARRSGDDYQRKQAQVSRKNTLSAFGLSEEVFIDAVLDHISSHEITFDKVALDSNSAKIDPKKIKELTRKILYQLIRDRIEDILDGYNHYGDQDRQLYDEKESLRKPRRSFDELKNEVLVRFDKYWNGKLDEFSIKTASFNSIKIGTQHVLYDYEIDENSHSSVFPSMSSIVERAFSTTLSDEMLDNLEALADDEMVIRGDETHLEGEGKKKELKITYNVKGEALSHEISTTISQRNTQISNYDSRRGKTEQEALSFVNFTPDFAFQVNQIAIQSFKQVTITKSLISTIGSAFSLLATPFTALYNVFFESKKSKQFQETVAMIAPIDHEKLGHVNHKTMLSQISFLSRFFEKADSKQHEYIFSTSMESDDNDNVLVEPTAYQSGTQKVASVLREAHEVGSLIQDAKASSDTKDIAKAAQRLNGQLAQIKNGAKSHLLIPIGIGEGKEYTTHFLLFEGIKTAGGVDVVLKHIHFSSPTLDKNSIQVVKTYDVSRLLTSDNLLASLKFFNCLIVNQPLEDKAHRHEKDLRGPTFRDFTIEKLLVDFDIMPVEDEAPVYQKASRDPVKMLYTVIKQLNIHDDEDSKLINAKYFPSEGIATKQGETTLEHITHSKGTFYRYYVEELKNFIQNNQEALTAEQQLQALKGLKWYIIQLRHYFEKEIGVDASTTLTDHLIEFVDVKIGQIEEIKVLEDKSIANLNTPVTLFSVKLNRKFDESIEIAQKVVKAEVYTVPAETLDVVATLKEQFLCEDLSQIDARTMRENFDRVLKDVDNLLAQGETKAARVICVALLHALPTAKSDQSVRSFWDRLEGNHDPDWSIKENRDVQEALDNFKMNFPSNSTGKASIEVEDQFEALIKKIQELTGKGYAAEARNLCTQLSDHLSTLKVDKTQLTEWNQAVAIEWRRSLGSITLWQNSLAELAERTWEASVRSGIFPLPANEAFEFNVVLPLIQRRLFQLTMPIYSARYEHVFKTHHERSEVTNALDAARLEAVTRIKAEIEAEVVEKLTKKWELEDEEDRRKLAEYQEEKRDYDRQVESQKREKLNYQRGLNAFFQRRDIRAIGHVPTQEPDGTYDEHDVSSFRDFLGRHDNYNGTEFSDAMPQKPYVYALGSPPEAPVIRSKEEKKIDRDNEKIDKVQEAHEKSTFLQYLDPNLFQGRRDEDLREPNQDAIDVKRLAFDNNWQKLGNATVDAKLLVAMQGQFAKIIFEDFAPSEEDKRLNRWSIAYHYYKDNNGLASTMGPKSHEYWLLSKDMSLATERDPSFSKKYQGCLNMLRDPLTKFSENSSINVDYMAHFIGGYGDYKDRLHTEKQLASINPEVNNCKLGLTSDYENSIRHLVPPEVSILRKTHEMRHMMDHFDTDDEYNNPIVIHRFHGGGFMGKAPGVGKYIQGATHAVGSWLGRPSIDFEWARLNLMRAPRLYCVYSPVGNGTFAISTEKDYPSAQFCIGKSLASKKFIADHIPATKTDTRKDYLESSPYLIERGVQGNNESKLVDNVESTPIDERELVGELYRNSASEIALGQALILSSSTATRLDEIKEGNLNGISELTIEQCFQFIYHYPLLLQDPKVRDALRIRLLQHDLLDQFLKTNAQFFVINGPVLANIKNYLGYKGAETHFESIVFLHEICGRVVSQARKLETVLVDPNGESSIVENIERALLPYNAKTMHGLFSQTKDSEMQKRAALHLLSFYAFDASIHPNKKLPSDTDYLDRWKEIIWAYAILLKSPLDDGNRDLFLSATQNFKDNLLPTIYAHLKGNQDDRNAFLDSLIDHEKARTIKGKDYQWRSVDDYTFVREDGYFVNLNSTENVNISLSTGGRKYLPSEVRENEAYRFLFSKKFSPIVSKSEVDGVAKFEWKDRQSEIDFEILIKKIEAKSIIQIFQVRNKGTSKEQRYQFYHNLEIEAGMFDMFNKKNRTLETLITMKGVWVSVDKTGKPDPSRVYIAQKGQKLDDPIRLHMRGNKIKEATIGEGANKKWVCTGLSKSNISLFPCSSLSNLLLLSSDKKHIDEIRFPDTGNKKLIKKKKEATEKKKNASEEENRKDFVDWESRHEFAWGLTLKRSRDQKGVWYDANHEDNQWHLRDTEELNRRFGSQWREFILPLKNKKTGKSEFYIYPYAVSSFSKKGSEVKFQKTFFDIFTIFTANLPSNHKIKIPGTDFAGDEISITINQIRGLIGAAEALFEDPQDRLSYLEKALHELTEGKLSLEGLLEQFGAPHELLEHLSAPTPIHFTDEYSSHAGYLYLALVSSLGGRWADASRHLQDLIDRGVTKEGDIQQLETIFLMYFGDCIKEITSKITAPHEWLDGNLPLPTSSRQVAFFLKMLVSLERIDLNLRTQNPGLKRGILPLFNNYKGILVGVLSARYYQALADQKGRDLQEQGLLLSAHEEKSLRELLFASQKLVLPTQQGQNPESESQLPLGAITGVLSHLLIQKSPQEIIKIISSGEDAINQLQQGLTNSNSIFKGFTDSMSRNIQNTENVYQPVRVKVPTSAQVEKLFNTMAEKINPDPHWSIHFLHLAKGSEPKVQTVLANFWDYIIWISETEMRIEDLNFLYKPLPPFTENYEEIETARNLILLTYHIKVTSQFKYSAEVAFDGVQHVRHKLPNFAHMEETLALYQSEAGSQTLQEFGFIAAGKMAWASLKPIFYQAYMKARHYLNALTSEVNKGGVKQTRSSKIDFIEISNRIVKDFILQPLTEGPRFNTDEDTPVVEITPLLEDTRDRTIPDNVKLEQIRLIPKAKELPSASEQKLRELYNKFYKDDLAPIIDPIVNLFLKTGEAADQYNKLSPVAKETFLREIPYYFFRQILLSSDFEAERQLIANILNKQLESLGVQDAEDILKLTPDTLRLMLPFVIAKENVGRIAPELSKAVGEARDSNITVKMLRENAPALSSDNLYDKVSGNTLHDIKKMLPEGFIDAFTKSQTKEEEARTAQTAATPSSSGWGDWFKDKAKNIGVGLTNAAVSVVNSSHLARRFLGAGAKAAILRFVPEEYKSLATELFEIVSPDKILGILTILTYDATPENNNIFIERVKKIVKDLPAQKAKDILIKFLPKVVSYLHPNADDASVQQITAQYSLSLAQFDAEFVHSFISGLVDLLPKLPSSELNEQAKKQFEEKQKQIFENKLVAFVGNIQGDKVKALVLNVLRALLNNIDHGNNLSVQERKELKEQINSVIQIIEKITADRFQSVFQLLLIAVFSKDDPSLQKGISDFVHELKEEEIKTVLDVILSYAPEGVIKGFGQVKEMIDDLPLVQLKDLLSICLNPETTPAQLQAALQGFSEMQLKLISLTLGVVPDDVITNMFRSLVSNASSDKLVDALFGGLINTFFNPMKMYYNEFKKAFPIERGQAAEALEWASQIKVEAVQSTNWRDVYFEAVDSEALWDQRVKISKKYFSDANAEDEVEAHKNKVIRDGIDEAKKELKEKTSHSLRVNQLGKLKGELEGKKGRPGQPRVPGLIERRNEDVAKYRSKIISFGKTYAKLMGLHPLLADHGSISDDLFLDKILLMVKEGKIAGLQTDKLKTELSCLVAEYHLALSEYQQLLKAKALIKSMKDHARRVLDNADKKYTRKLSNPADLKIQEKLVDVRLQEHMNQSVEWMINTHNLLKHLEEGTNRARYAETRTTASGEREYVKISENGKEYYVLEDPQFSLKYLDTDTRKNQITRLKAKDAIDKMLRTDPPVRFVKVRMGIGKSTFIFPEMVKILLEKGKEPVMVTTEQLLPQLITFMGRKLFVFNFDINYGLDAKLVKPRASDAEEIADSKVILEHLVNLEKTLYRLKDEGRNVITTTARLAALRNKRIELQQKLAHLKRPTNKDSAASVLSQQGLTEKRSAVSALLQQVKKIEAFFKRPSVISLEDEDLNRDISFEYNYACGGPRPADPFLFDMSEKIMETILTHQKFASLREMMVNNTLRALPDPIGELREVYKEVFNDTIFWEQHCKWDHEDLKAIQGNLKDVLDYVLHVGSKENEPKFPSVLPKWDNSSDEQGPKKFICAMKKFTTAFDSVYNTHAKLERGVTANNGCTVVPFTDGVEKERTQYGEESEIIAHHFLHYVCGEDTLANQKDPSKIIGEKIFNKFYDDLKNNTGSTSYRYKHDYLKAREKDCADKKIEFNSRDTDPHTRRAIARTWEEWASNISLVASKYNILHYEAFALPECAMERFQLVRYILQNCKDTYVKIFERQIECNSQDVTIGNEVLVASGTGDAYALNLTDPENDVSNDPEVITGETILTAFYMDDQKVINKNAPIGLDCPVTIFKDPLEHIKKRAKDPHCVGVVNTGYDVMSNKTEKLVAELRKDKNTQHRQIMGRLSKTLERVMWNADSTSHESYDLRFVSKSSFTIYGPQDSRGVDFGMPASENAYVDTMIDLRTGTEDKEQGEWRSRLRGMGQRGKVSIDEKMDKFVRSANNLPEIPEGCTYNAQGIPQYADGRVVANWTRTTIGHVYNAVKKKTLKDDEVNHIKAASFKIKLPTKSNLGPIISKPYNEFGLGDEGKELLETFESHLFSCHKSLYIKKLKINWKHEYQPQKKVDPITFSIETYTKELAKLRAMQAKFLKLFETNEWKHLITSSAERQRAYEREILPRINAMEKAYKDIETKLVSEKTALEEGREYEEKLNQVVTELHEINNAADLSKVVNRVFGTGNIQLTQVLEDKRQTYRAQIEKMTSDLAILLVGGKNQVEDPNVEAVHEVKREDLDAANAWVNFAIQAKTVSDIRTACQNSNLTEEIIQKLLDVFAACAAIKRLCSDKNLQFIRNNLPGEVSTDLEGSMNTEQQVQLQVQQQQQQEQQQVVNQIERRPFDKDTPCLDYNNFINEAFRNPYDGIRPYTFTRVDSLKSLYPTPLPLLEENYHSIYISKRAENLLKVSGTKEHTWFEVLVVYDHEKQKKYLSMERNVRAQLEEEFNRNANEDKAGAMIELMRMHSKPSAFETAFRNEFNMRVPQTLSNLFNTKPKMVACLITATEKEQRFGGTNLATRLEMDRKNGQYDYSVAIYGLTSFMCVDRIADNSSYKQNKDKNLEEGAFSEVFVASAGRHTPPHREEDPFHSAFVHLMLFTKIFMNCPYHLPKERALFEKWIEKIYRSHNGLNKLQHMAAYCTAYGQAAIAEDIGNRIASIMKADAQAAETARLNSKKSK